MVQIKELKISLKLSNIVNLPWENDKQNNKYIILTLRYIRQIK